MKEVSIKKNFIYSMGYQILILITPFITTPYVSRVLGADGIGIYSYTSSIMSYFTLVAALGTSAYGAREIAQHRNDKKQASKLFWEIELMTIFTSLACLAVWIGFIIFGKEYRYCYLALTPLLLGTMFDISWFFTGYEQMQCVVSRNSVCKIIGVVLLFVLVRDKGDLIVYILINSLVTMIGNLSMWTYLPQFLEKVDRTTLTYKKHFKETLIYFIPAIATSIYTVLDKTLIGLITHNDYENGYYEQATKIINLIKALVFTSVNTVMGARISYLFAEEKYEEIHQRIEKSLDFILLMGFACVFGLIGIAKTFVPFFFGEGYGPVVQLLYVFAPIIIIIGISNCMGSQYYTPSGRRAQSAKFIVAGSCVNLCLNLILIPKMGSEGAAIASIIAELTITVLYVAMSDGYMSLNLIIAHAWKRVVAGVVMCACVYGLGEFVHMSEIITLIIQVVCGAIIYLGILALMKDVMMKELLGELFGKVLNKVKNK